MNEKNQNEKTKELLEKLKLLLEGEKKKNETIEEKNPAQALQEMLNFSSSTPIRK